MRFTVLAVVSAAAILVGGCVPGTSGASPSTAPAATTPSAPPRASASAAPESSAGRARIETCDRFPRITAPADRYRDTPIYVANEMPVVDVKEWAEAQPAFEVLWIDHEHNGWITLAFSANDEARQAELERRFPGAGVVAVGVDWKMSDLRALQSRVTTALQSRFGFSAGIAVMEGVVAVHIGVLKPDRVALLEELFAGERICIEGIDPAGAPAEGPQSQEGDGWRLLADAKDHGEPYRTGTATDDASYEKLWASLKLPGKPRPVDFRSEVVVWFGAVYGSTCPDIRLDDVVVDAKRKLLHAKIVLVDAPSSCTADARPRAYLVAVDRSKLPSGAFAIQLRPDDASGEERTLVDVDLSKPGAVAGPGDARPDPATPKPHALESGEHMEPVYPRPYRLYAHCGVEWLGRINDVTWRADVPVGAGDLRPEAWKPLIDRDQYVVVTIVLSVEPPTIEATANGHTVVYRPTTKTAPGCD